MIDAHTVLTIDLVEDDRPERFSGTPDQIVEAMNNTAFSRCATPQEYMARWNRFYDAVRGGTFRTESAAAFVEDMLTAGVAVRVDDVKANG